MDERDRTAIINRENSHNDKIIVYAAMFNPMIHESISGVISLHWDKKDAEMAIEFHKEEYRKDYGISPYMEWSVCRYEVR